MIKKIFFIFIFYLLSISYSFSENNIYILTTVDDKIITNYDIQKESEYLKILNPSLSQLDGKKIFKISKESLVNEIIKEKEIYKYLNVKDKDDVTYVNDYLKQLYTRLNFNNETEFQDFLKSTSNYSLEEIKQKLKIEIMWNELIYLRYSDQVKINKKKLEKKIESQKNEKRKEYQLSEIVFNKTKNQSLEELIKMINVSIQEIGFENTANIYSTSESAKLGGKIGWITENNLSEKIAKKLINIQEGQTTNIIELTNSYLILKVNKIRNQKIFINKEEELNKMIQFETNKQLNQYSKIFFDKSKMNYTINEK